LGHGWQRSEVGDRRSEGRQRVGWRRLL
jgi:hypothetical protein